jgi:hypothetical protein
MLFLQSTVQKPQNFLQVLLVVDVADHHLQGVLLLLLLPAQTHQLLQLGERFLEMQVGV